MNQNLIEEEINQLNYNSQKIVIKRLILMIE